MKYPFLVLAAALVLAAVGYGGADDPPGLQRIGALLALGALVAGVRTAAGCAGGTPRPAGVPDGPGPVLVRTGPAPRRARRARPARGLSPRRRR